MEDVIKIVQEIKLMQKRESMRDKRKALKEKKDLKAEKLHIHYINKKTKDTHIIF